MAISMLRTPEVLKRRGKKRSTHYADIKAGLFVRPVKIGIRAVATPDNECNALVQASIAGQTFEEIRALVARLEAARIQSGERPYPESPEKVAIRDVWHAAD